MHVKIHKLFEVLMNATRAQPEAALGWSSAASPKLRDFLAELDGDLSLDWSGQSFQGMNALRKNVIAAHAPGGICNMDHVLITAGTAEANFLAISQLVQADDELIVDAPGWQQALVLGQAIGCAVKLWQRNENDAWALDLNVLESLITPRTRMIFLCNPNNPTGRVTNVTELQDIVRMADRVGAYVLCDEVYAGLEWSVPRAPRIADLYPRGISTGSVSKGLGLQGLRTGWMICRDPHVIREGIILRENTSEIMNVLGEAVAEIALRPARFAAAMANAREDGARNLALLDRFIAGRPELAWHAPQAGLIGFCRLNLELDGDALAARLLAAPHRTFAMPGSAYGFPQHVRLGVGGGAAANLEEGISRLGTLLDAIAGAGA